MADFTVLDSGEARDQPPESTTRLQVVGPITHANTPVLRDHLRSIIDRDSSAPCPHVLVDLSDCPSVDVDGLLALAVAQQAARHRGGELHLLNPQPLIARQVRQHNFDDLLHEPARDEER